MEPHEHKEFYRELERRTSQARIREGAKRDQLLVSITAGTLALSVTFMVNFLAKEHRELVALPVLISSWGLLVLSLVTTLLSYVFIDFHFIAKKKELHQAYKTASLEDDIEAYQRVTLWMNIATWFDYLAIFSGILGIILFAYFGSLNIQHLNKNSNQNTNITNENRMHEFLY